MTSTDGGLHGAFENDTCVRQASGGMPSAPPRCLVQVKNVANTGVVQWGGRLLALHESGLPHEMRLCDLSTVGETTLGGSIQGTGPFAAHYRIMHQPDGSRRCRPFRHCPPPRAPASPALLLDPSAMGIAAFKRPAAHSNAPSVSARSSATHSGSQIEMTSQLMGNPGVRAEQECVVVCRCVTFGCTSEALNADVTFFEYGEDGSLLQKSNLNVQVSAV